MSTDSSDMAPTTGPVDTASTTRPEPIERSEGTAVGGQGDGGEDKEGEVDAGKKRSAEEIDEGDKGKRPCDMCRKRKIKCTPLEEQDSNAPGPSSLRCKGCTYLDIPCTYLYVNKRPGRPSKRDRENGEHDVGSVTAVRKAGKGKEKIAPMQKTYPYQQPPQDPRSAIRTDAGTYHRPEKRQRTGSRQSQETPHPPPRPPSASAYDESFAWTPGLSMGSFGEHPEYEAQRDFGYPTGGAGEDGTLQPFVPDFSGYSVGKEDRAGEVDRGYGNPPPSTSGNLQSSFGTHPHASSTTLPTPSYRHSHPTAPIQPGSYYHSQTRAFPDQPIPLHQRTSSGPQHSAQGMHPFQPQKTSETSTGQVSTLPLPPCPQIEDVTSWSNISFFISLHLRYQHPIMPIIHKPTFNNDLALRLDRQDEQFRAFLLSLVAYVICQVPRSKMIGYFSQQELEDLQSRCRTASRLLQDRQRTCNTLTRICTHILDYFYSQTVGDTTTATMLLAQGVRLAFCLGLHEPTPVGANGEMVDHVALQLRRRIFFQLYNTDKTDASSGMQILMNDFEGVPPYPLCIDDELITTEGNLPQPVNRPSYMTGFVANVQLMQILSECMRRHRTYQTSPVDTDVYAILMWIEKAQTRMRQIIQGLPDVLGPSPPQSSTTPTDQSEVFATQRANLLITAVSAEFALLDLKAMADPSHDISSERELVGREMYSLLSSIPIEHLAANGESMRGKVLRIIIALLNNSASPENWNQHVRDWWEIYSKVQFVQMIPMNVDSLLSNANAL